MLNSKMTSSTPVDQPLYQPRKAVYPKAVDGFFRRLKWAIMAVTLAIYYVTPWLRWNRGEYAPNQAVLIDMAHRRFFMFSIEIWPHEFYFVAGLLIMAGIGLFLVTSAVGRAWCGYACPQTVWTDLFVHIERAIDGDRNAQTRLAAAPWTPGKIARRLLKWSVWLLIAAATGGAWIFYFADAPTLFMDMIRGDAAPIAYLTVLVLTATTYVLGGLMREQVCTYMCPWPRIQAAMVDSETMSVTYLKARGEPRGPHKKGASWDGRGDCIDCNQCIAACPMGIDIRDGDQLECINCALCIDACDDIMAKIGRPHGLIAYQSVANIERKAKGRPSALRFLRARTVLYAVVLSAVAAVMLFALATRSPIDVNVLRDRNPMFVRLQNGDIRNAYTVKLMNRSDEAMSVEVTVEGLSGAILQEGGQRAADGRADRLTVAVNPDELRSIRVLVTAPAAISTEESVPVAVVARDTVSGASTSSDSVFMTGAGKP